VLIRADMDALPMEELNNHEYKSTKPGIAHACGHDAHTAIGLVAAKILASKKDEIHGSVKFVFQPAEEGGGGGRVMIEEGVLENPHVDEVYGLHMGNINLPGQVATTSGPLMASGDIFTIDVSGKGGHGGMPDSAIDPIVIASNIVLALQTIVSRNISPYTSAVVSVCQFISGSSNNIIPETASLRGTIRSFDPLARELIMQRMDEICTGIGKTYGGRVKLVITAGYPATVNSPDQTEKLRLAAQKVVGAHNVMKADPVTASEDFSYFLENRPGCYFFVGSSPVTNLSEAIPHHSGKFDIAEDPTLVVGASVWVQLVEDLLMKRTVD